MKKERSWQINTALFLGGQCFSMLGSSMVQYAIMWYLLLATDSGGMMTLYVLAGFLPHVIISPIAGVLADRFSRKRIILLADSAIALVTLALAFIFLSGFRPYWLFLLAALLRSVGGGLQAPAVSAVLPQLVPADKLMRVNGLNGSVQSLIYILSPALGGLLLSLSDIVAVFFVDVVTAAVGVSILCTLHIPLHAKAQAAEKGGYLGNLLEGFRYVRQHGYIKYLLLFYTVFCVFIAPASFLAPVYIGRTFGSEVWMLTVQEICYSGGAIVGGLLLSWWGGFKNQALTIGLGTLAFGGLTMLWAVAPGLPVFYLIALAIGLTLPLSNTPVIVLLQERVDNDILGRVFSLLAIVGAAGAPCGMLIFGPLADIMDIRLIFVLCGVAIAGLGLLFLTFRRKL